MSDKTKNVIKELIPYIVIIIVVIIIRSYIATPVIVDGISMEPTLYDGNVMILNKLAKIDRYDIVVIRLNNGETLIKRVMGLPGEEIECIEGKIYIDGEVIEDKSDVNTEDFSKVSISDNEYFVMGDNRDDSLDSRMIGTISKDNIEGVTSFIFWPIKSIGNVK